MGNLTGPIPPWWKRFIAIAAPLAALPGALLGLGMSLLSLVLALDGDSDAIIPGLYGLALLVLTAGGAGLITWHSLQSLQKRPSKPVHLPPLWQMAALFGLLLLIGQVITPIDFLAALLLPPMLFVAALLPPLLAVTWFANRDVAGLTWRRGLVTLAGGATVGLLLGLFLEMLFPFLLMALVLDLADSLLESLNTMLMALGGQAMPIATGPGFIYMLVHFTLVGPLAEEVGKSLVVLPLVGRLPRRVAFLVGAVAGAGFAAVENLFFAGVGLPAWGGVLLLRALGGAVHPLGSGLMALGWRGVLKKKPHAWPTWAIYLGLAAGIHGLWNGGSLLLTLLAGEAGLFSPLSRLSLFAAAATLALMIALGLAALWLGRLVARERRLPGLEAETGRLTPSDRVVAIWALACLVVVVPVGITGLHLLMSAP